MEVIEVHRHQLQPGQWLMPWYDKESGKTASGDVPIPEKIDSVIHDERQHVTGVKTHTQRGDRKSYVFRDDDRPEIVL
jgi:hypothetical protein